MRRTLTVLCGLPLAAALALLPAGPARADGLTASLGAPSAKPGATLRVTGAGWPAGQLLQLVTCGELAMTGSGACDMRAALATPARADGTFSVELRVGDPPRPCPCVVHVALVGTGATGHVDVPLDIPGHATGPVPTAAGAVARLDVVRIRLAGRPSWTEWFGARAERTLVYEVRNPGAQSLRELPLNVRVGKGGGDPTAAPRSGEIRPGETREYRVPVTIPFAAFGRYQVRADIAGLGEASVGYDAYPWGLLALNAFGIALIVLGVHRRLRSRRAREALVLPQPADPLLLPPLVRVPALGAVLVFDDAPDARRLRRRARAQISAATLRTLIGEPDGDGGTAVVDLAALDAVLTGDPAAPRRQAATAATDPTLADVTAPGGGRPERAAAVVDLGELDAYLAGHADADDWRAALQRPPRKGRPGRRKGRPGAGA
ncbi:hypothetical protein Daura_34975 [Dactylosporangium aurantiacum]|uniref:Uncharacterized protein n=1 Tax=Dactylosporangium aurantiacum TaxID=35754 RepID=A0A9Q9IED4_9ACTN|nr:hypothetical protein [Dactylosporangium aurantiacum]MDG6103622.1 hypothetical protein [Dactylosporangium aurantiacum]UWZ51889.1 hypothetical protein Daura_34975 [Dactylosporangium aurantiacum]